MEKTITSSAHPTNQVTLWFEKDENGEIQLVEHGEKTEIKIDVTKIPVHVGRRIGRVFYHSYLDFIKDPENKKMIDERVAKRCRERVNAKEVSPHDI